MSKTLESYVDPKLALRLREQLDEQTQAQLLLHLEECHDRAAISFRRTRVLQTAMVAFQTQVKAIVEVLPQANIDISDVTNASDK